MTPSITNNPTRGLWVPLEVKTVFSRVTPIIATEPDWVPLLEQTLTLLIESLRATGGEFWHGMAASPRLRYGGSYLATSTEARQPEPSDRYCAYGEGLIGQSWQQRRWQWQNLSEYASELPWDMAMPWHDGIQAVLTLPLETPPFVGVLCLFYETWAELDETQRLWLDCLAAQLNSLCQLGQHLLESQHKQQQYQRLVDVMPGIVFQAGSDTDWSMQYLSAGCEALTGYLPDQLIGRRGPVSYNTIIHPEDLARVLQTIDEGVRQRQAYVVEYRICPKDGPEKWVWEKGNALLNAAGHLLGIEGFITEITDRKAIEQALKAREDFLQLVLNSIPNPVLWKNRKEEYLGCNQTFAAAVGRRHPSDIVGLTDADFDHLGPEDIGYYKGCDRIVIEQGEADLQVIEPLRCPGGEQRWVTTSRLPMHDAAGEVIGVLAIFNDITEHLAAQRSLKAREQYLSTISELQRPLLTWQWDWQDKAIAHILAALGKVSGASRVYYYELSVDVTGQRLARQRGEWSAPGVPPTTDNPLYQTLPIDPFLTDWFRDLSQGQSINVTQQEFSETQWQLLAAPPSNVKSLLLLPLMIKGELQGTMGFSNCHSPCRWEPSEVDLLRVATADIALAIERRQAELSLQQAERNFRSMFENAVEGIFQTTLDGQYITVNPMLARLYGYDSPADLIANLTNIDQQLYVEPDRRQKFVNQIQAAGAVIGFESQVYRKDGRIIWISESARAVYSAHGGLAGYEGTVEDITERKRGEAEILHRDRLLQGVAEASHCLLTIPDFDRAIPPVLATLGEAATADRVYIYEHHTQPHTGAEAMSMRFEWTRDGIAPSIDQPHWQNKTYSELEVERWYQAFALGRSIRGLVRQFPPVEQRLLGQDGILSILMVPIFVEQQLWGFIGFDACRTAHDWTINDESILVTIAATLGAALKRQQTEAKMCYQAYHDSLTGLPNRSFFNQQLPQAIQQAHRQRQHLAVIFLDLDHFKTINDTLSHAVGDELLRQVTRRIAMALREDDVVARWGGDEFTLILPHIASPQEAATTALNIAESLRPPFLLNGHELHITTSMGIALFPQDGTNMTTLMQNADAAMYQAKSQGRNNYQFYTQHLGAEAAQRLQIETVLHHALDRQEFRLYYQPQVNVATGTVEQMEALIRWQHPDLGVIAPDKFIPLAEDNGLIIPIGEWVIQEACAQVKQWRQAGWHTARVAINLSARQLQHPHLVAFVADILKAMNLPAQCLELEITETAAMADVEASVKRLQELRQLGVKSSMDDFGTGYSCLSYLKQFPMDGLKIDRAFTRDLPTSEVDRAMVQAIIAMAKGLNLQVIAEGVETRDQVAQLQGMGCYDMQGYFFSRPIPAAETETYLKRIATDGLWTIAR